MAHGRKKLIYNDVNEVLIAEREGDKQLNVNILASKTKPMTQLKRTPAKSK